MELSDRRSSVDKHNHRGGRTGNALPKLGDREQVIALIALIGLVGLKDLPDTSIVRSKAQGYGSSDDNLSRSEGPTDLLSDEQPKRPEKSENPSKNCRRFFRGFFGGHSKLKDTPFIENQKLRKRDKAETLQHFKRLREAQGKEAGEEAFEELLDFVSERNAAAGLALKAREDSMLTVHRLEVPSTLNGTLTNTNIIENTIRNWREATNNVKLMARRWRGGRKARAGLAKVMGGKGESFSFEESEVKKLLRAWGQGGRGKAYRVMLLGKGQEKKLEARMVRKGMAPEQAQAELTRLEAGGVEQSIAKLIQHRIRYFSDGVVIGGKDFVEEVFEESRSRFGPKRVSGARKPRGALSELKSRIWTMRDLQKE